MLTKSEAQEQGFAGFNNYPHLCVDAPDGGLTISVKTSEGRRITFSLCPYTEGGAPQIVDIKLHDGPRDGNKGPELMASTQWECGRPISVKTPQDKHTLVTIPLKL